MSMRFQGMSEREQTRARMERLVALLEQSNQLIAGLGQYVPDLDPNRSVITEVLKTNSVVLAEENDALHKEEMKSGSRIITL